MQLRFNSAFTMVELLVTFSIIAILIAMSVPTYNKYRIRAKVSAMVNSTSAAQFAVANDYFNQGYTFTNSTYTANSAPFVTAQTNIISSIAISSGVITVTGDSAQLGGRAIVLVFTPTVSNNNITWTCAVSSTFFEFVPDNCKNAL